MSASVTRLGAALLVALVSAAPPASAFRVFLDADVDGDPTTFRNEVDGPLETPVTIVVSLDEGDAELPHLSFGLAWDCTPENATCFIAMPHGSVDWPVLEDSYPFSSIGIVACTGLTCECQAYRGIDAVLDDTPPGNFPLGTLLFSRLGKGNDCDPLLYPDVEFRVECWDCDYAPGDEAFTTMRLLGSSPATAVATGPVEATWGRSKAAYR
ncbi:hypothetical protein K8I85_18555 [bacterium]|nr:hypothetical protein [bacterium]